MAGPTGGVISPPVSGISMVSAVGLRHKTPGSANTAVYAEYLPRVSSPSACSETSSATASCSTPSTVLDSTAFGMQHSRTTRMVSP